MEADEEGDEVLLPLDGESASALSELIHRDDETGLNLNGSTNKAVQWSNYNETLVKLSLIFPQNIYRLRRAAATSLDSTQLYYKKGRVRPLWLYMSEETIDIPVFVAITGRGGERALTMEPECFPVRQDALQDWKYSGEGNWNAPFPLRKGTIEMYLGRTLSWEDEPAPCPFEALATGNTQL